MLFQQSCEKPATQRCRCNFAFPSFFVYCCCCDFFFINKNKYLPALHQHHVFHVSQKEKQKKKEVQNKKLKKRYSSLSLSLEHHQSNKPQTSFGRFTRSMSSQSRSSQSFSVHTPTSSLLLVMDSRSSSRARFRMTSSWKWYCMSAMHSSVNDGDRGGESEETTGGAGDAGSAGAPEWRFPVRAQNWRCGASVPKMVPQSRHVEVGTLKWSSPLKGHMTLDAVTVSQNIQRA